MGNLVDGEVLATIMRESAMPPDQNNWVEMPNWLADAYRLAGEQLRLTAVDLITDVMKMSDREYWRRRERPEPRHLGYQIASWTMQALAAEYLLKSLSLRDAGRFRKSHDLLKLLKVLEQQVQDEIVGQGAQQGIAIPEFLEKYRKSFVEWRYPFEDMSAIPEPVEFDNVLAVLVGVCEPGSLQARRILETENRRLGS